MRLCTWTETGTEFVSDITVTEGETEIPCEFTMRSIVPDKMLFPFSTDHLPELFPGISGEVNAFLSLNFQTEGGKLYVAWKDSNGHSDGESHLVIMSSKERSMIAESFLSLTPKSMNISPALYRMQERYVEDWAKGKFHYGLVA